MIQPTIIPTIHDHGYNPSICEFGGLRLMAYRHHPNPKEWRTKISIQEVRNGALYERPLRLGGIYTDMSHEDGRFFTYKGTLWMSLTVSAFPGEIGVMTPCATVYGPLVMSENYWTMPEVYMPNYGLNNFVSQEKNWVFFEHEGVLNFIYQGSPEQSVCRLDSDGVTVNYVYRTESPSWHHGEIRGGTQPLPCVIRQGKWLRFFHSLHKHGNNRSDWSYCIGALEMQHHPPFQIERISKWPVFSGDERFVPGWRYWKQGVAIVYGVIEEQGGWLLSCGLNDSLCSTLKVTEKDLNF